jgi:microcystin-dependent protein
MDYYLGAMMLVPYNFAPVNFALCQGQLLPISQYTALFSLLGTYYGGNGTSTFALPNLQGVVALGMGNGPGLTSYSIGETGGSSLITLLTNQVPPHNHNVMGAKSPAVVKDPNGAVYATATGTDPLIYTASATNLAQMEIVNSQGGNGPHENRLPFLTLNWIICMQGVFPPRS